MKVTGLAIVPPPTAAELPKVTPELLASVLARYSRSNEGIGKILGKVDLANPDASIDRILNFVDYGHASIGGLTGLFLRFEDWLVQRASARALYRMDDVALHDIALSRSDVERVNDTARKAPWRH